MMIERYGVYLVNLDPSLGVEMRKIRPLHRALSGRNAPQRRHGHYRAADRDRQRISDARCQQFRRQRWGDRA